MMIKNVSLQTESDKDSPIEIMRGNLSPGTGPFQYGPLQRLEHPIQPDDDVSIKDPTIKTVDRSRLSHSPHHMLQISGKSLEQDLIPDINKESYLESPKIAFSQKSLETTIKEAQTRLLSPKFLQRWRVKSTIDQRVNLYLHKDIKQNEYSFTKDSNIVRASQHIQILNLIFMAIYFPIILTYKIDYYFIGIISIGYNLYHIAIEMNTQYSVNGQIIKDQFTILRNYLSINFYLEFFLLIANSLIIFQINSPYLWIPCLMMEILIGYKLQKLTEGFQFDFNFYGHYFEITKLLIKLSVLIHFLTCLWSSEIGNQCEYRVGLVYVVSILTLNNMYQIEEEEIQSNILIVCAIEITSLFIVSYIIKVIDNVIKYDKKVMQLSEFIKENNLQGDLKYKIKSFILGQKQSHSKFINQLSQPLIKEFNIWVRYNILKQYFKQYQEKSIISLTEVCSEIVYMSDQIIIKQGTIDDYSLYIILEGEVNVVINQDQVVQKLVVQLLFIKSNQTFGELSFYTQQVRKATVISHGTCKLLKISRSKFLDSIQQIDKQIFSQIKDEIEFDNILPMQCFCCFQNTHIISECPKLTFRPDRERVIKQFLYPYKQQRVKSARLITKKQKHSYYNMREMEQIQDELNQLFIDNPPPFYRLNTSHVSESQLPYEDQFHRDSYTSRTLSKVSRGDKSIIKSTSLMKQQSIYDQVSIHNNDNIFLNVEQDHEFSIIKGSDDNHDDDQFANLINRNAVAKRTFATAGFGEKSIKEQTQTNKSLNVIIEKESSELSNNSNPDESPVHDPLPKPTQNSSNSHSNKIQIPEKQFVQRKQEPKLTFNHNFDGQFHSDRQNNSIFRNDNPFIDKDRQNSQKQYNRNGSGSVNQNNSYRQNSFTQNSHRHSTLKPDSVRQNSSRSLTYTPFSNYSNNNQIHNQSSKSIVNNNYQRAFTNRSNLTAQTVNYAYNFNDSPDIKSMKSRTNTQRKKSTKTNTRISAVPSSFQPFSGLDNPEPAQIYKIMEFDKMQIYDIYYPHYNYDIILKKNRNINRLRHLSYYFLSYDMAVRIHNLKISKQRKNEYFNNQS